MEKTVLVIGASGGIGAQVADDLVNQGYSVIGTHLNSGIANPKVKAYSLDLLSKNSIREFINEVKSHNAKLYAIINCAGICEYEEGDMEKDLEIWDKTIAVNLTSNFILAKQLRDIMEETGRFIMISSTDAMYGGGMTVSYSASKAGVNSLAKSLSLLFKDKSISVNAVAPGWVNTRMIADTGEEFIKEVAEVNPLKRIAHPRDISNVISFLLKPESSYINGQVITVDGGYTNQDPTLLLEEETVSVKG